MERFKEEGKRFLRELIVEYGLGFELEGFWEALWYFLNRLEEASPKLNLKSRDLRERLSTQVLESLILASVLPEGAFEVADLGTGGGIPGVVLKLARPELEVTMFEAFEPRVEFLLQIVEELGLKGTRVRKVQLGKSWPEETFPVVVARGYGSVEKFVKHARRLLSSPGMGFYLWREDVEPWGSLEEPLESLKFELPSSERRTVVYFQKGPF